MVFEAPRGRPDPETTDSHRNSKPPSAKPPSAKPPSSNPLLLNPPLAAADFKLPGPAFVLPDRFSARCLSRLGRGFVSSPAAGEPFYWPCASARRAAAAMTSPFEEVLVQRLSDGLQSFPLESGPAPPPLSRWFCLLKRRRSRCSLVRPCRSWSFNKTTPT